MLRLPAALFAVLRRRKPLSRSYLRAVIPPASRWYTMLGVFSSSTGARFAAGMHLDLSCEANSPSRALAYSYCQTNPYLRCHRSYRYRYLDGWSERDRRVSVIFGRCFEKALEAYFCHKDSVAVLSQEWGEYREAPLEYGAGDSWHKLVQQGTALLHKFVEEDRIRVRRPKKNLQVKMLRTLSRGREFESYIDAMGEIDGHVDWTAELED
jgi:hypothetical protein